MNRIFYKLYYPLPIALALLLMGSLAYCAFICFIDTDTAVLRSLEHRGAYIEYGRQSDRDDSWWQLGSKPVELSLANCDWVRDQDVRRLSKIETLQVVNLSNVEVSDSSLSALSQLSDLRVLFLDGTNISDTSLAELALLSNLTTLSLSSTGISNAGIEAISESLPLRELRLDGTHITDESTMSVPPTIVRLDLSSTKVTDEGVRVVANRLDLRSLRIAFTECGDASIEHLAHEENLEVLDVSGTRITNRSITLICDSQQKLQHLYLGYTQVSGNGIKQLSSLERLVCMEVTGLDVNEELLVLFPHVHIVDSGISP